MNWLLMDGNDLTDETPAPDGAIVFPGLENALIGFGSQWSREPIAVYSAAKIVKAFVAQGMSEEEASEWFEFNVRGLWAGERTPLILEDET